ncbi:MAG TPA: ATP-binding protein, partial [Pedococcus sp.]
LRALVQAGAPASGDGGPYRSRLELSPPEGDSDLAELLRGLSGRTTTVSVPGGQVPMPTVRAVEIVAAVRACLDNVARHVGADAPAWVLLEDLGDQVVVTVRDEGPGIAEGRLVEAASQGRLGVAESIRGRVTDLGGTTALETAPGQGTEWELTFPR